MHGTYVLEGNSTTVHIFVNADAKGDSQSLREIPKCAHLKFMVYGCK